MGGSFSYEMWAQGQVSQEEAMREKKEGHPLCWDKDTHSGCPGGTLEGTFINQRQSSAFSRGDVC